jgi:hypothetical protein
VLPTSTSCSAKSLSNILASAILFLSTAAASLAAAIARLRALRVVCFLLVLSPLLMVSSSPYRNTGLSEKNDCDMVIISAAYSRCMGTATSWKIFFFVSS